MGLKHRCALCAAWLASMPAARPVFVVAVLGLNVIHPLIHGTPLDGGALDSIMANLDMLAAGVSQEPA